MVAFFTSSISLSSSREKVSSGYRNLPPWFEIFCSLNIELKSPKSAKYIIKKILFFIKLLTEIFNFKNLPRFVSIPFFGLSYSTLTLGSV